MTPRRSLLCAFPAILMALSLGASLPAAAAPSASEQKLIDTLIANVQNTQSMKFMRNGKEHGPDESAKHLRDKFNHFKDKIVTAEDFIRLCGTRSEVSKVPYKVRIAGGATRNAGDYLNDELRKLRRQAKA
jgi:hypothetical protein